MSNPILQSLIELTGNRNVVTVHKPIVEFTGNLRAALLLEQLLYWTPKATLSNGWIAKSDKAFAEELSITPYGVREAKKTLMEMGVIQIKKKRFKGTPTLHYRVNQSKLGKAWSDYLDSKSPFDETGKSEIANKENHLSDSSNPFDEMGNSLTENTAKTSSKPTQKSAAVASAMKSENPDFEYIRSMLKKANIGEPTRSQLAAMPKLSKQLFLQVQEACRLKGGKEGLFVTMLREAKPLLTEEEERKKYVKGEFADFIEH